MKKIFLDENVFFAATFSPTGGSSMLFELAKHRKVELFSSLYALNEAKRNILLKGGKDLLLRFYQLVSELQAIDQKKIDEADAKKWEEWIVAKDAPILISAQRQKVDFLVTLDKKDFKSKRMGKAPIRFKVASPGEFIQSL